MGLPVPSTTHDWNNEGESSDGTQTVQFSHFTLDFSTLKLLYVYSVSFVAMKDVTF